MFDKVAQQIENGETVDVNDLMAIEESVRWSLPFGSFKLKLFDGEVPAHKVTAVTSSMFWRFHKTYSIPILMDHYYGDREAAGDLLGKMLDKVLYYTYDTVFAPRTLHYAAINRLPPPANPIAEEDAIDELMRMAKDIENCLYNYVVGNLGRFVTTLSLSDYFQILSHPKVKEVFANMRGVYTEESIRVCHSQIQRILETDEGLANNRLVKSVRRKALPLGSVIACIAPQGFGQTPSSEKIHIPITTGLAAGVHDLGEHLAESSFAANALQYSKGEIQGVEYFNRKLQLFAMYIESLEFGDCGSTHTIEWMVTPNNLKAIVGRVYVDDNGGYHVVRRGDRQLVGTTLRLRSPQMCNHLKHGKVCSICYGDLAINNAMKTWNGQKPNIGYVSAIELGGAATQGVMAIKHHRASMETEESAIPEAYVDYLIMGTTDDHRRLNRAFYVDADTTKYYLCFSREGCGMLMDIQGSAISLSTLRTVTAQVNKLMVKSVNEEEEDVVPIPVGAEGITAAFTPAFIRHMRNTGFDLIGRDIIQVPLDGWDFDNDIFVLPNKGYNMIQHIAHIDKLISDPVFLDVGLDGQSKVRSITRKYYASIGIDAVIAARTKHLYEVVALHSDLELIHIEMLLAATICKMGPIATYQMAGPDEERYYEKVSKILIFRSPMQAMAWQGQIVTMTSPKSFLEYPRPDHPLDGLNV